MVRFCVAVALSFTAAGVPAFAEPFFVEMRDGTFKRCGNLDFKAGRKQWVMRGCEPMAALFAPSPTPTMACVAPCCRANGTGVCHCPCPGAATPRPTHSPRPTNSDPCSGGCTVWDPVTDTTKCVRPCP